MPTAANAWEEPVRLTSLQWVSDILDGFDDAFCAFDFDWRVVHANRAAEQFTGFDRGQVMGRTYWELVPRAAGTEVEVMLRGAMIDRQSIEIELPSALRPGTIVAFRAFPIEGGLGLSFRDVTARHEQLMRERDQAARLQLAMTASGMGDWSWDASNDVLTLSDKVAEIFGVPPGPVMTWTEIQALIHPDDREATRQIAQAAFDEHGYYEAEFRVRPRDRDGELWVMSRAQVQLDVGGAPTGMIGVLADISAAKAREAALRESEARFRMMADCAPAPVWVTSAAGPVEFVNQAFADYAGRPREDLLGNAWIELLHPADVQTFLDARAAARTGPERYTVEGRFADGHGGYRWMRTTSEPRFDTDGVFQGYVGIAMDMTDVREADGRRQLMINELNHRVKNTLATVQSIAQQTARLAVDKTELTDKLLSRLMALSAAHDRLTQATWDWTPLADIVADQMKLNDAAGRFSAEGPPVTAPPNVALSLSLALHELATNAMKYGALSGPDGHVAVTWRREGADLAIEWREADGPLVQAPERRGFGSRLLDMLGRELNGDVALDFQPGGLVWTARFPMPERERPSF